MTFQEFRNNQLLVDGARKIFEDPVFKQMLEILDEEGPLYERVSDSNPTEAAVSYGRVVGYINYAKKLKLFTTRAVPKQDLTPDYGTYSTSKTQ